MTDNTDRKLLSAESVEQLIEASEGLDDIARQARKTREAFEEAAKEATDR